MTLKNISDSSLEELTKQLPKDAKIIKVVSLDENTSEIEVLYQEENIKLPLNKVEVSEVLGGSLGEIKVNRNTSPKKALAFMHAEMQFSVCIFNLNPSIN